MNLEIQNIGYGVSWVEVLQSGSFIVINVEENVNNENRAVFINAESATGKTFQIYLNQDNKIITFDTTIQTFDSTILTFDAE